MYTKVSLHRKVRDNNIKLQLFLVTFCYFCLLCKVTSPKIRRFHREFSLVWHMLLHKSQPLAVAEYGHCGVEDVEAAVEGYALVEAKDAV